MDGGKSKTQAANTQESFSATAESLSVQQERIFTATAQMQATQTQMMLQSWTTATQSVAETQAANATATEGASQAILNQSTLQQLEFLQNIIDQAHGQAPIYGPTGDTLVLDDSGYVKGISAEVDLLNFVTHASFYPPYDRAENEWDIGIFFRDAGAGEEYRLMVVSDGFWSLENWTNDNYESISHGTVSNLNLDPSTSNQVLLFAIYEKGYFFLNDIFIAELDLSARLTSGKIASTSSNYQDNFLPGAEAKIEGFTIWDLP